MWRNIVTAERSTDVGLARLPRAVVCQRVDKVRLMERKMDEEIEKNTNVMSGVSVSLLK